MTRAMKISEFKENKEKAFAFIVSVLRENASYEDGQYYFHFTAENDEIIAFDSYMGADTTVTASISADDMCRTANMDFGSDLGDILANFEDTERFNDVVEEIYDSVISEIA